MSSLSLGVERPVRLSLHDARGRLIWTASLGPGHETVPPHLIWNGMDLTGRAVGSGTYFLRLEGGGSDVGLRIVRLR